MIKINNLHVEVEGKHILKGINLEIKPGEVHAIMGPNGSGKSTLSYVLAGKDGYEITQGSIEYKGQNINDLAPEERAWLGIFLAFQYPVAIAGIKNTVFLRTCLNAKLKAQGKEELNAADFLKVLKSKTELLDLPKDLLNRSVNDGFSGGEKKRNEILQMAMLEPDFAVLDETDSGLDIDALKVVAQGVNSLKSKDRSMLVITHYQRLLDYIVPDVVHVLANGKIIKTGDKSLALELEEKGYAWLTQDSSKTVSLPGV
ncbi:Fe-S cluster assembly ATPase SufC [bacterium]|nr:Fe-S cluster assembly ATPase SufC [bacterium]